MWCYLYFCCSVPTFTVVPEAVRAMSPLIVDSDDDDDSDDEDDDEDDDDEDEPSEGVPIEQYRAWLGESLGFLMLCEILRDENAFSLWVFYLFRYLSLCCMFYSRLFLWRCIIVYSSQFLIITLYSRCLVHVIKEN